MRKLAFIGALMFILLSCKCKKDVVQANTSTQAAVENIKTTDSGSTIVAPEKDNVSQSNLKENLQEQTTMVEYNANTRGYFLKLVFSNGKLMFTNERDSDNFKTVQLDKTQLDELNKLLSSINVDGLSGLKDPTQKRFYDGAAIANLKITKNGKEYNTVDFDHGFPPAAIEKFVSKLVSYTK